MVLAESLEEDSQGGGFGISLFFFLTGLGHVWAVMGLAVFVFMTWVEFCWLKGS